jgi:protease secretion system membrane fusion protein
VATRTDEPPRKGLASRIDGFFDKLAKAWNPYHPDKLKDRGMEAVVIEESTVRKRGARITIVFILAFLVWSVTMPLDAGVVMPGSVTVAGYRKAVQHPSGGVVSQVLVAEGAQVQAGQVLLRINPLENDATVANLEQELINLLVSESRAKAELMGRPIVWDPQLAQLDAKRVGEAKLIQLRLHEMRTSQFGEQVRAFESQISGINSAISAHQVALRTLNQELESMRELAKEGFIPRAQMNSGEREQADKDAALQSARSEVGKIRAQIAEVRSQYQGEIAKEMAELEKNRESVNTKLQAARFAQSLAEIRAPVGGTVVNLKVYTQGGVIGAGEVLMEIVPREGMLLVETKVPPSAIDRVRVGQEADIRFAAFNSITTPVVRGIVKSVGVDKLKAKPGEEVREGEDYYLAQIETTPEAMAVLGDKRLQPGMPADVIVKRGQRTFMSYLLKPLTDKFALAFKD